METQELQLPNRSFPEQGISPALLPQSAGVVTITTERGKEVPLTLAGYRLSMGATYQLRLPEPVVEMRLVGFPRLLVARQGETQRLTKHGVRNLSQPIRVKFPRLWESLKHPGVYPEELELEATLPDGRKVTTVVPVVLALDFTWRLCFLLIAWALLSLVWGMVAKALPKQDLELFTSLRPWLWGLLLALLYPAITLARRFDVLRNRAKELHQQYRNRWVNPSEGTARTEGELDPADEEKPGKPGDTSF